ARPRRLQRLVHRLSHSSQRGDRTLSGAPSLVWPQEVRGETLSNASPTSPNQRGRPFPSHLRRGRGGNRLQDAIGRCSLRRVPLAPSRLRLQTPTAPPRPLDWGAEPRQVRTCRDLESRPG